MSKVAIIRTSDSMQFLGCRRRWNWSSHLRENFGPIQAGDPLWLGAGFHYALEDYHGAQKYGDVATALRAFAIAYKEKYPKAVPDDWRELLRLGIAMAEYYPIWLTERDPLKTFVFEGIPQLEANIKIPIPFEILEPYASKDQMIRIRAAWDEIWYSMQFDRVIIDENDYVWIVEYKTAKRMETNHFQNDAQITRYVWGAKVVYGKPVAGVIYQQHRKDLPKPPRELVNGTFSVAQNQLTTHRLYRKALIDKYGEVKLAPKANIQYLNSLTKSESADSDAFIRRDRVYRNNKSDTSIACQILMQVVDMLDPELKIYPNPTRMCANYCPFMSPCVSYDDGSDWEHELALGFVKRPEEYDLWRDCLPDPKEMKSLTL